MITGTKWLWLRRSVYWWSEGPEVYRFSIGAVRMMEFDGADRSSPPTHAGTRYGTRKYYEIVVAPHVNKFKFVQTVGKVLSFREYLN